MGMSREMAILAFINPKNESNEKTKNLPPKNRSIAIISLFVSSFLNPGCVSATTSAWIFFIYGQQVKLAPQ